MYSLLRSDPQMRCVRDLHTRSSTILVALVGLQICEIYCIVANVSVLQVGRWFRTLGDIEIAMNGVEATLIVQHDSMTA